MSLTKVSYSLIQNAAENIIDHGADPSGVIDSTAFIQQAINVAETKKTSVFLPAGTYKITSSLIIREEIDFYGEGSQQSFIVLHTNVASTFALHIDLLDNSSFIGAKIGNIGIRCNGGSARGIGIFIETTATNSAVSNCVFENMFISHVTVGFSMTGVIYMSTFRNITISGGVDEYGWFVATPQEIIYNSYEDLEVTNVNDGAYAYYFDPAPASQFRNLTADGCCYFAGAYTGIKGLTVEGMFATTPPANAVIELNLTASLTDVAIINIPNSKCIFGIRANAQCTEIANVRFPDAGAGNQPNTPVFWNLGNTGTLSNVRMDRASVNKLEDVMSDDTLNGFVMFNCDDITDRSLSYYEGTWTPAFATWSTAPTVSSAKYIRVGRLITVFLNFNGGVCVDGSTITGLPFTSNSTVGGTATMASNDVTKRFTATIAISATEISNIPAQTLTGVFSQLTATYFAA